MTTRAVVVEGVVDDDKGGQGGGCRPTATATACTPRRQQLLKVVVVESHQQVLPHVHQRLRGKVRRRRPCRRRQEETTGTSSQQQQVQVPEWNLVHFDSHADMACPVHVPARLCWRPYPEVEDANPSNEHDDNNSAAATHWTLYDHLESTTSGIAEWVLPLVLGANCARVTWIRPPPPPSTRIDLPSSASASSSAAAALHQQQLHSVRSHASFSLGHHRFHVGAWVKQQPLTTTTRDGGATTAALTIAADVDVDPTAAGTSYLDLPSEARIRIDSDHPYYADDVDYDECDDECDTDADNLCDDADAGGRERRAPVGALGCYAPTHELLFARPVHLVVSYGSGGYNDDGDDDGGEAVQIQDDGVEGHQRDDDDVYPDELSNGYDHDYDDDDDSSPDWILDVCLDYFWCDNPFDHDLRERNAKFADALTWLVTQSILYDGDEVDCVSLDEVCRAADAQERFVERRRHVLRFRRVLGRYLCAVASSTSASAVPAIPIDEQLVRAVLPFYPTRLVDKAQEALDELYTCVASVTDADERTSLVQEALEAIPYQTLPRDDGDFKCVFEARLRQFRQWLHRSSTSPTTCSDRCRHPTKAHPPMLITVARSSTDGFLSMDVVDEIQEKVLDVLHERYCGDLCRNQRNRRSRHGAAAAHQDDKSAARCCALDVVLDYEEIDFDDVEQAAAPAVGWKGRPHDCIS